MSIYLLINICFSLLCFFFFVFFVIDYKCWLPILSQVQARKGGGLSGYAVVGSLWYDQSCDFPNPSHFPTRNQDPHPFPLPPCNSPLSFPPHITQSPNPIPSATITAYVVHYIQPQPSTCIPPPPKTSDRDTKMVLEGVFVW